MKVSAYLAGIAGSRALYRVLFHDETCKECKLAEYACVCDDAGKEPEKKK